MSVSPVNRLTSGSAGEPDCGMVALSVYLGVEYLDVVRAATLIDRRQGRAGLWARTMVRIADMLGHKLKIRRRFDLASDYGILRMPEHAAVLRAGLVFDRLEVWGAKDYLRSKKLRPSDCALIVSVD